MKLKIASLAAGVLVIGGLTAYTLLEQERTAAKDGNQNMEVKQFVDAAIEPDEEETSVIDVEPADNDELGEWVSETLKILSEPADDPRLKEANHDEGFEYYLKSRSIKEKLGEIANFGELDKDKSNISLLATYIYHLQFVRTSHLGLNGEAIEATELTDKWKPVDENMKQAYEYLYQLLHDLDIAVNRNGEGETYGVTYLLNGDKVSEMEKFISGEKYL